MLSVASDFSASRDNPEPYLRAAAEAGFSHIHWCHQWCTDYLYTPVEINAIRRFLREFDLKLLDLHGSMGPQKNWGSLLEWQRQAGVELVANRIQMTAELGGDAVVMHFPRRFGKEDDEKLRWDAFRRSLDELLPLCRETDIRIAVENSPEDNFIDFFELFQAYPADVLGLCYDSGHGNIQCQAFPLLEQVKDRLIAVHLHDNDGEGDQHKLPFDGTIDWDGLAKIIATSAYQKPLNLEISKGSYQDVSTADFL